MDLKKITDNILSKHFNEPIDVQIENERLHISYEYTSYYTIVEFLKKRTIYLKLMRKLLVLKRYILMN